MEKENLINALKQFLDSCFKTSRSVNSKAKNVQKTGASSFNKSPKGYYKEFEIKISNSGGFIYYNVPWLILLKDNNVAEQGIYPLILANVKAARTNKEGVLVIDVCYGISKKNESLIMWENEILKKGKTSNIGLYPDCRINKTFWFKNLEEFHEKEDEVITALDEVIQEYNKVYSGEK